MATYQATSNTYNGVLTMRVLTTEGVEHIYRPVPNVDAGLLLARSQFPTHHIQYVKWETFQMMRRFLAQKNRRSITQHRYIVKPEAFNVPIWRVVLLDSNEQQVLEARNQWSGLISELEAKGAADRLTEWYAMQGWLQGGKHFEVQAEGTIASRWIESAQTPGGSKEQRDA